MAIKKVLTSAEFDKLSDDMKKEYKKSGDEYHLDLEGDDDLGALKRAKEHEKLARIAAEKEAKETKQKLDDMVATNARSSGDVAALDKSWQQKLDEAKQANELELKKRDDVIAATTVEAEATKLAAKISISPTVMLPHIRSRLRTEIADGRAIVRVLDINGQPSALSLTDLEEEFKKNSDFKPLLIGSRASGAGGGGSGGNEGGGAAKDLSKMTEKERIDFFKTDPDGFRAASAAQK